MRLLISGGAGYVGCHGLAEFLTAGHTVSVVDNFVTGSRASLLNVRRLTGRDFGVTAIDLRNRDALNREFRRFQPDAVIHFAGLKSILDSFGNVVEYYDANVGGTIAVLEAMSQCGVHNIVFSSSATVYGNPQYTPCDEHHPLDPTNPYGRTKQFVEKLLRDWCGENDARSAIALRYFNPAGAHPSGWIGELAHKDAQNVMPILLEVASGQRDAFQVFGRDYDTRDGSAERDFIHVVDLAIAHVRATEFLAESAGFVPINIGTGSGSTVLEMARALGRASGRSIRMRSAARRAGDVARSVADVSKAGKILKWHATRGIDEICRDAWTWHTKTAQGLCAVTT